MNFFKRAEKNMQKVGIEYSQFGRPIFKRLNVQSGLVGWTQLQYVQYHGRYYSVAPEYVPGHGEVLTIRDDITMQVCSPQFTSR